MTDTFLTLEEHLQAIKSLKTTISAAQSTIRDHEAAMGPLVGKLYGVEIGSIVKSGRPGGVRYIVDTIKPRCAPSTVPIDPRYLIDGWSWEADAAVGDYDISVVKGRKLRKDGTPSKTKECYVGLICDVTPVEAGQ